MLTKRKLKTIVENQRDYIEEQDTLLEYLTAVINSLEDDIKELQKENYKLSHKTTRMRKTTTKKTTKKEEK